MADFYEDFKNNINNRPEPEFNPADWADMNARLDARTRRTVPLWWWTTGALLLLLVGSNMWWLSQKPKTEQELVDNTNSVILRDTVFQKEIIYRVDTLVQIQRIIETKSTATASPINTLSQQLFATNGLFSKKDNNLSTQRSAFFQKEYSANDLLNRAVISLQTSNSSTNEAQAYLSLANVATKEEELELAFLSKNLKAIATEKINFSKDIKGLPLIEKEKYRRKILLNTWRKIQPTGFNLEANGNFSVLLNSEISEQNIRGAGLTASIEFSPTFRLLMSSSFEQLSYKANEQGEAYGIPIVAPPSNEFNFKYAEINQAVLHFTSGFQYYFRADKKWKPYVGIGIGGRYLNAGSIKYEYENGSIETEKIVNITKRPYQLEYLDFQTGVSYQWNDHWQSRFGLEYLQYTKENTIPTLRFQLGTGYSF